METIRAEHVVLGAGAVGTAAAYHLARRGEPVVLVEQFRIGHDRGSSHGSSRIARHSYPDLDHASLMIDAFEAWRQLEADAGRPLFVRCGGVSVAAPGSDYVGRVTDSLRALGVAHRRSGGAALRRSLPPFAVPDNWDVVFEPDAGLLHASAVVAAQAELAQTIGGERTTVLEGLAVRSIDLDGDRPTLLTDGPRIEARRLIVAAGAWAPRLLPSLPIELTPTLQTVFYFRPPDPAAYAVGRLPVFIAIGPGADDAFYGLPDFLGAGVKVARHGGPPFDPSAEDRPLDPAAEADVRAFLGGFLPGLAGAPLDRAETCAYTMAADELFVVGPLPGRPDLIVASPCSGHGFKFANLVGRALADLAIDGSTSVPIGLWSPTRAVVAPDRPFAQARRDAGSAQ